MRQIILHDGTRLPFCITTDGNCYSLKTRTFLLGRVRMCMNNRRRAYDIHMENSVLGQKFLQYADILVARAYLDGTDHPRLKVAHIDNNLLNNDVNNLRPCKNVTLSVNKQQDYVTFDYLVYVFNKDKEVCGKYKTITQAAKATGLSREVIIKELNTSRKTLLEGKYYVWRTRILPEAKSKTLHFGTLGFDSTLKTLEEHYRRKNRGVKYILNRRKVRFRRCRRIDDIVCSPSKGGVALPKANNKKGKYLVGNNR